MPKEEGTLVVIKPDGVARNLIGKIISRYEIAIWFNESEIHETQLNTLLKQK